MAESRLEIRKPDDMHVHFRQGPALAGHVRDSARYFGRALVMPNILPPVTTAERLNQYRQSILDTQSGIIPLMTFKIVPELAGECIEAMISAGAVAGKLYPDGVTTHSEGGVRSIEAIFPALDLMQERNMVLSIHAEAPGVFSLIRESAYLPVIDTIRTAFPGLRIVIEHASQKETVEYVKAAGSNIASTVTVHHLLLTLDDILGNGLQPHHFCKPVVKSPADQAALREAVFSGNPKFFLGTDSAPHSRAAKERDGAAGIYTSPVAIPLLAQLFEEAGVLSRLENFCSRFGCAFYGLDQNSETIVLRREPWEVPEILHGTVPFYAGRTITWR